MRTLKKNKQKLYYSNYSSSESVNQSEAAAYFKNEDGSSLITESGENIVEEIPKYMNIGGVQVPIVTGLKSTGYTSPVIFYANIDETGGGNSVYAPFGLDRSTYSAVIVADRSELDIKEGSIIWAATTPKFNNGILVDKSADYKVAKIGNTLNQTAYALVKNVSGVNV